MTHVKNSVKRLSYSVAQWQKAVRINRNYYM